MTNVVEKLPNIEAHLRAQLYYYQITGIKEITLEPIILHDCSVPYLLEVQCL